MISQIVALMKNPVVVVLAGMWFISLVIISCNTSIVEVGIQPYGTVIYKNCINNHYYVKGGRISGNAIIEDSVVNKALDGIENNYYIVREYSGLFYWRKDRIINVLQ